MCQCVSCYCENETNIIFMLQGSLVSLTTESSSDGGIKEGMLHDKIKIVSQQSTARPGCIIQLDPISDATHVRFTWTYFLKNF